LTIVFVMALASSLVSVYPPCHRDDLTGQIEGKIREHFQGKNERHTFFESEYFALEGGPEDKSLLPAKDLARRAEAQVWV
jgi:hypothetical protein